MDKALSAMVFAVYTTFISVGALFFPLTYSIPVDEKPTPLIIDGIVPVAFWQSIMNGNRALIGVELLLAAILAAVVFLLLLMKKIRSAAWPVAMFIVWFVGLFVMGGRIGDHDAIGMNIDRSFETYLAWTSLVFVILVTVKGFAHLIANQQSAYTK